MKTNDLKELEKKYKKTKNARFKAVYGLKIMKTYTHSYPKRVLEIVQNIKSTIESECDASTITDFYYYYIKSLINSGELVKAEDICQELYDSLTLDRESKLYAHLLEAMSSVYAHQGNYKQGIRLLYLSIECMQIYGTEYDLAWLYQSAAHLLVHLNKLDEAVSYINKSLEVFSANNPIARCDSLVILGMIYKRKEEYEKALEYYKEALQYYTQQSDTTNKATNQYGWLLMNIASVYSSLNCFSDCESHLLQSLDVFREHKNISAQCFIYENLGKLYLQTERYSESIDCLFVAKNIAQNQNLTERLIAISTMIGYLYYFIGDYEESESILKDVLTLAELNGYTSSIMMICYYYGKVLLDTQRFDESIDYLSNAIFYCKSLNKPDTLSELYVNIGRVFLLRGEVMRSYPYFIFALEKVQKDTMVHADILLHIALFYTTIGRYDEALEYLQQLEALDSRLHITSVSIKMHELRSIIYKRTGETELLIKSYEKLLDQMKKKNPSNKEKDILTAKICLNEKKSQDSVESLKRENNNLRNELVRLNKSINDRKIDSIKSYIADTSKEEYHNSVHSMKNGVSIQSQSASLWNSLQKEILVEKPYIVTKLMELCPEFSRSELKVCVLLSMQLSTKDIAAALFVDTTTIDKHRQNIRKKLHLPARADIVKFLFLQTQE